MYQGRRCLQAAEMMKDVSRYPCGDRNIKNLAMMRVAMIVVAIVAVYQQW